ncbi:hypothetical protein OUY22_29705 [Nonomuraea sp. MCN248]|uniref:Hydantoinase/oxoprolinase N-terminal domain-containing protein n=1 Tax=Nonomuraea corallina TaxID=2989783 RepID=A0ABT4SK80_9ACTN|nr:hydantoinase/oxoprolinase N-terminal domain-containing protein [Nonomuraea corallina]MDA0637603.1 hypothetical protein [Nonomuraea corallina]
MSYRVAMDIGGTFTDVVRYDERTGEVTAAKAPTTPHDPAEGVFAALGQVYQIAKGNRERMFDLRYRKPAPLVPRRDVMEIGGRLDWRGDELVPLDEEAVRRYLARAEAGALRVGPESAGAVPDRGRTGSINRPTPLHCRFHSGSSS